jgi:SAM-dependent methyltransferase
MIKLYSSLAPVYHEMYQQIFDYDNEFRFYHSVLKKKKCRKIVEIGCGTGLLAKRLLQAGYDYTGVDLYPEMLEIAKRETQYDGFISCDMKHLHLKDHYDCALITGRSLAYVTTNAGLLSTFRGIHQVLKPKGILIFDAFDANEIFENFTEESEQVIQSGDKTITRKNVLRKNLATGWTWDFVARYIIEENNDRIEHDDFSTLRAFTKEELRLLLKLAGFHLMEVIKDKILTFIARKID